MDYSRFENNIRTRTNRFVCFKYKLIIISAVVFLSILILIVTLCIVAGESNNQIPIQNIIISKENQSNLTVEENHLTPLNITNGENEGFGKESTSTESVKESRNNQTNQSRVFNILMWTDDRTEPFVFLKNGSTIFEEENCEYKNCFITANHSYLPSIKDFDVLLFHAPEFTHHKFKRFIGPIERSPNQLYIFTSVQSPHYYPVCDNNYDNYFNWTWTYKLSSEVYWRFIDIRDMQGNLIGPDYNINWIDDTKDTISDELLDILQSKTKAVAWIVDNCETPSGRNAPALILDEELQSNFELEVDTYGECSSYCGNEQECKEMIMNEYRFYLAFENSIAEDYVTFRFLNAVENYAVPIVFGGADYNRFAPPNAYIHAGKASLEIVAKLINDSMYNLTEYAKYHHWRNHYKYQRDNETPDTRGACRLCKALNEKFGKFDGSTGKYKDFKNWWNGDTPDRC